MQKTASRIGIMLLGSATIAGGSWLLLGDARAGRGAPGVRQAAPAVLAARRERDAQPSAGYGYGGACRSPSILTFSTPSGVARRGRLQCVATTSNATGDNPDQSLDVFVAELDGHLTNMTRDVARCRDGTNAGLPCSGGQDCPNGFCSTPQVTGCATDARGRTVIFLFNGNPTGENPDLGFELFAFDTRHRQLVQTTKQTGWCSDDVSRPCSRQSECGVLSRCVVASMSDLQVNTDGHIVTFLSTGDPGGNPQHGLALFALAGDGIHTLVPGTSFCASNTAHAGSECTTEADCGAICGNGFIEAPEQCDAGSFPFGNGGCPGGQFCEPGGSAHQCTCAPQVCGDGVREGDEACDGGSGFCTFGTHCRADCSGCISNGSPSAAFLGDPGSASF